MAKFKRHLPMSATIAIVVHVAIILFLVVGFQFKKEQKANPLDNINTINATVINSEKLDEKKTPKENDKQEKLKQKKLAEENKQQEIKQKQEEEKQQLQTELEADKEKAEAAQKRAEAEQQKAEEILKQAEIEKQRLEEEVKKQAETEKLAKEKKKAEEAKKVAAEKKRKEEAKKLAQKKAEEKKRKEAEKLAAEKAAEQERLAKILAAEEAEIHAAEAEAQRVANARAMSRDIAIYQDALRSRIQSRWRKPLSEQSDAWCKVYVRQAPGGYVEDVVVEQCTGDEAFRRSVEEAVWKSDPLPEPPSPELFDRDLRFKFIPEI